MANAFWLKVYFYDIHSFDSFLWRIESFEMLPYICINDFFPLKTLASAKLCNPGHSLQSTTWHTGQCSHSVWQMILGKAEKNVRVFHILALLSKRVVKVREKDYNTNYDLDNKNG